MTTFVGYSTSQPLVKPFPMGDFLKLLRRFVPPYKKYLCLNLLFNLLAAVLTVFSFAIIIPILEMLFGIRETGYSYMAVGQGDLKEVILNNFYYYTQEGIASFGPSKTLALLAAVLVAMTALKTGTTYLSSILSFRCATELSATYATRCMRRFCAFR